jgi:two-component system sensor histidine kinase QseC
MDCAAWRQRLVTALVREELAELTPLALEKDVELVLDGDETCQVDTDPVALAIALQNLVTNALNFSPPGSEVWVRVQPQASGAIHLSVEDSGPGIDEQDRARLLERFYSQGNANGAGLGLAIVNMIAGKIGSQLELHNRAEGGLCARLLLTASPQAVVRAAPQPA